MSKINLNKKFRTPHFLRSLTPKMSKLICRLHVKSVPKGHQFITVTSPIYCWV